jgi:SHS2 domain-containing protein
MPWRELPHTADLLLEITAPDWPSLVVEATLALAAHLGTPPRDAAPLVRPLRVEGVDREDLLVRWLAMTLVWQELDQVLAVGAEVQATTDTELVGSVRVVPAAHLSGRIKAVTYHDLAVRQTAAGWSVRIVFDT